MPWRASLKASYWKLRAKRRRFDRSLCLFRDLAPLQSRGDRERNMSTRQLTEVRATIVPAPPLARTRRNMLQRKCACGGTSMLSSGLRPVRRKRSACPVLHLVDLTSWRLPAVTFQMTCLLVFATHCALRPNLGPIPPNLGDFPLPPEPQTEMPT